MNKTIATLFSGGGGVELGAMPLGYKPIWGVEYIPEIAAVYAQNIGNHITVDDVRNIDPHNLEVPAVFHASPVCTRVSKANVNASENELDISCARKVAEFIRVLEPPMFTLENVREYRSTKSIEIIREALRDVYSWWEEGVFNAADFGVPQNRIRFFVRASHNPIKPPMMYRPVTGWYEAIEDLLPTLKETQFAEWQLKRLPQELLTTVMVEGDAAGERCPTILQKEDPCFTLKTAGGGRMHRAFLMPVNGENSGLFPEEKPAPTITENHSAGKYRAFLVDGLPKNHKVELSIKEVEEPVSPVVATQDRHPIRAWLSKGKVVAMSTRCLARFQSFPDWYILPDKTGLATTIIGNSVPPKMYQAILESMEL